MIYTLKKDTPLAPAGTPVYMEDGVVTFTHSAWYTYEKIICYVDPDNFSEWLEEIPEKPKTVWDLEKWDDCWIICEDSDDYDCWYSIQKAERVVTKIQDSMRELWLLFLTEQEAKNAIIRMETANRRDKFVPNKLWDYWYFCPVYGITIGINFSTVFDIDLIRQWLAFRTKEECKAYMTDEVKRAFWYIQ